MNMPKRSTILLTAALFVFPLSLSATDSVEALYKAKCAMCHGADGKGTTPAGMKLNARDFHSPEVAKQTDAQLRETLEKGKNKMPAYKDKLKEDELESLVGYVRGLAKKK
jgi:cytochrome c6